MLAALKHHGLTHVLVTGHVALALVKTVATLVWVTIKAHGLEHLTATVIVNTHNQQVLLSLADKLKCTHKFVGYVAVVGQCHTATVLKELLVLIADLVAVDKAELVVLALLKSHICK
jgi:hypothetical protein